jgi:hypothetical protein
MKNYDLIAVTHVPESLEFDAGAVADLTVKQMHLLMTKLHMLRYALHGARQRESLLDACEAMQGAILTLQRGDQHQAINDADRHTLLVADVELARYSVGLVVAQSTDANAAFALFGEGGENIDLSSVLKE